MAVLDVRAVRFGDAVVQRLVADLQAEFVVRYGGPDATPLAEGVFDPPRGLFLVGYADGRPVAMGGWRLRPDVIALGGRVAAEVKRMYVEAGWRGHGFARAVLRRLEETARGLGADVMVLETGLAQPEAIGLYESSGYVPVEPFGYYRDSPQSRYFGKRLDRPTAG
jgi:GNAT superfamily N-acetyltransferase